MFGGGGPGASHLPDLALEASKSPSNVDRRDIQAISVHDRKFLNQDGKDSGTSSSLFLPVNQ